VNDKNKENNTNVSKSNVNSFFDTKQEEIVNSFSNKAFDSTSRQPQGSYEKERTTNRDNVIHSPVITDEINSIRNKYIIGKMAGENLVDSNGRIIISKNEIITSDVIAKADREGKLPDLIISMILPGMES